jgi:hypothetical protein
MFCGCRQLRALLIQQTKWQMELSRPSPPRPACRRPASLLFKELLGDLTATGKGTAAAKRY